jgi:Tol biopolymer transport system component
MTNRPGSARVRIGAALAAAAGVVVIVASPASATFPGELNGKIAYAQVDPSGNTQTIWTINPNGRGAKELTKPVFMQGDFFPRWSANGQRLVFGRLNSNSVGIWTMDADGGHQTLVTSGFEPAWSPDGRWIVFRSNTGPGGLFKIRSTAPYGLPIRLTHPPAGAVDEEPNWSADGTRIAYVETTGTSTMRADIDVLSVSTGRVTKLTGAAAACGAIGTFYSSPNFSPSSQRLLFSCINPGTHVPETVFVMSASGGTPTKITVGGDPGWSPVRGHIVYSGANKQGSPAVLVATNHGTDADVVVSFAYEPDWQPIP